MAVRYGTASLDTGLAKAQKEEIALKLRAGSQAHWVGACIAAVALLGTAAAADHMRCRFETDDSTTPAQFMNAQADGRFA
jgi:hypothetical protein